MARTQNIGWYVGEDRVFACELNPVEDITGWTIKFAMRTSNGSLPVLIEKDNGGGTGLVIINGPASRFNITILSADSATLDPGVYVYDIQRTDVAGHTVLVVGTVTLTQPPTPITPP